MEARGAWLGAMLLALLPIGGCVARSGLSLAPAESPFAWPARPRNPRIAYVGQLSTAEDLQPEKSIIDGAREALFGKTPTPGVLSPFALCTDDADRLFVADTGSQRIHVFNVRTREYQQWTPTGDQRFTQPVGVAWDPAGGRLVVSDSVAACLFVFDSSGKFLGTIA